MKTVVDERLRQEAKKYNFRFSCGDCAYFAPESESCSEGYPIDEHRDAELLAPELLFCKLFEAS